VISLASELSTFLLLTSLTIMFLSGIWAIGTIYLETEKLYSSVTIPASKIVIEDFEIEDNLLRMVIANYGTSSTIISHSTLNVHVIYYSDSLTEYKVYKNWTLDGRKINVYELLPGTKVELEVELETLPPKDGIVDIVLTSGDFRVEWAKKF